MAITRTQQQGEELVRVSRHDVFSNDGDDLAQRAQFSVTGFGCTYELYYHTEWDRPVLECYPEDPMSIEPSTFFKVDVKDITVADTMRLLLSKATGGAVTDFEALEMWEPWATNIDAMNYKEQTVKESEIAQFTVVTSMLNMRFEVISSTEVADAWSNQG
jgi:hypothetical protein